MSPTADVHTVSELADAAFCEGRVAEALRWYVTLLDLEGTSEFSWYRSALLLARLGEVEVAGESLDLVAARLAEGGALLLALAAARELQQLEGETPRRGAARVQQIAALYGAGSPRVDPQHRLPPPPVPTRVGDPQAASEVDAATEIKVLRELAREACARAAERARTEPQPAAGSVPGYPLLCDLAAEDLAALVPLLEPRAYPTGATVIEQGTEGASFFILVRGVVNVLHRSPVGDSVPLARLRSGAFFGEMALLTDSPRAASVVCERPTLLLELGRSGLEELALHSPRVAEVLASYTRERLLRNLMATSPLFAPLDAGRREALIHLFETQIYGPGERVLEEGQPSQQLHVVLSGAVRVTRHDGQEALALAELGPGQIFGEISLFQQGPATATVQALRKTVVLSLSREAFNAHVAQFPEMVAHVYRVAVERAEANRHLEAGPPLPVGDDLILI